MHAELVVKTPSLAGSSELLVIAPIKPGFVPSLDAITYTTRSRMLLRALHAARRNAHEFNLFRAVSDAVERVGVIQTLRLAVLEPDGQASAGSILLSVNFDGSYEAYVRTIWQKSARLLDLIFCNTLGHVTGWDHSHDQWSEWLRSRQVDTPFYYGPPGIAKPDFTAMTMQQRLQRREADVDLLSTRCPVADAEHIAWELIQRDRDPQSGPHAQPPAKAAPAGVREGIRQGLTGLAGVFRLTELYAPVDPVDGPLLHRAAHELLPEFQRLTESAQHLPTIQATAGSRLAQALAWFSQPAPLPAVRRTPRLPSKPPVLPARAQAGILQSMDGAQGACVCLIGVDGPAAAAALLSAFTPTPQDEAGAATCVNLALSFEGLRACGLSERVLGRLPLEFQQGMQRRAGVLGDQQANHPRRWSLPRRNTEALRHPRAVTPDDAARVPLEAVHALLHVRFRGVSEETVGGDLATRLAALESRGVRLLSVQWLRRRIENDQVLDHFGYADGLSDPVFGPDRKSRVKNQVHLGEALIGHPNAADAAPALGPDLAPLLRDASFLVVRKLIQDVAAFERAVQAMVTPGRSAEDVKAKLMGRWPDGRPLVPFGRGGINDFDYQGDPEGSACPFAAHIRRANPRSTEPAGPVAVPPLPGARPPHLLRRGMSYADPTPDGKEEKGLFFMAYNASIGEQFEVVQRWLAGGNSPGAPSGGADPICGVPEAGRRRFHRFEDRGTVVHMPLDGDDELGVEATPLVRLAWGGYFLAPSLDGLAHLRQCAEAAVQPAAPVAWDVRRGAAEIDRLLALEASAGAEVALQGWKTALEDPESRRLFLTASVWAAVRALHGGLLRTPYGVLVASEPLVDAVLGDCRGRYTVAGYQLRLKDTLGPIFLGLDAGPEYDRQAGALNDAIQKLGFDEGYLSARKITGMLMSAWIADATVRARSYGEARWELNVDVREITVNVLGGLLELWFGLRQDPDKPLLRRGEFTWAPPRPGDPAPYPGSFYTPSRYTFQPNPTETVRQVAERDGRHLRRKMTAFLQAHDAGISAKVTRAVLDDLGATPAARDYDLAARTIAGAIMGFVPTTDNNLRRIVGEWLLDQTLWRLRAATPPNALADPVAGRTLLHEPIVRAMMLRPMPEFIWRTATEAHTLPTATGRSFDVAVGDRMVLGLVSVTQQGLEQGARDVTPIFGGNRWANPSPRHACPGMPAAMGVMAGLLGWLVDTPLTLRPAAAAGLLSFEGPVGPANPAGPATPPGAAGPVSPAP
jgi:Dyp-type peroxidase family